MTKSIKWLLSVVLLSYTTVVGAQTLVQTRKAEAVSPLSSSSAVNQENESANFLELALLRSRLEEERTHNAAILQTVYWSLGVLATVAAALIGFGWLANFRVYEREKESLTQSLNGDLNKGLSDLRQAVANALEDSRNKIGQSIDLIRNENASNINEAVQSQVKIMHQRLQQIERTLKETQLDKSLLEAEYRFEKHSYGNSFSASLAALKLAKDLGRTWVVESVLSDLEKRISRMDGVFSSDLQEIAQTVEHLEGVSSVQRDRLAEALRRVRKL